MTRKDRKETKSLCEGPATSWVRAMRQEGETRQTDPWTEIIMKRNTTEDRYMDGWSGGKNCKLLLVLVRFIETPLIGSKLTF